MTNVLVVETSIDDETKAKATQVLDDIGLSVSDAVRLMMQHIANDGALPFLEFIPNAETVEAMEAARRGETFGNAHSIEELMAQLRADD
jgi:DNA-damage-inducible protein J